MPKKKTESPRAARGSDPILNPRRVKVGSPDRPLMGPDITVEEITDRRARQQGDSDGEK